MKKSVFLIVVTLMGTAVSAFAYAAERSDEAFYVRIKGVDSPLSAALRSAESALESEGYHRTRVAAQVEKKESSFFPISIPGNHNFKFTVRVPFLSGDGSSSIEIRVDGIERTSVEELARAGVEITGFALQAPEAGSNSIRE